MGSKTAMWSVLQTPKNVSYRIPTKLRITHVSVILALIAGLVYLNWRLFGTFEGSTPWLFWPLIAAEAFGWLSLLLFSHEAWTRPPTYRRVPLKRPVDVLIPTYDEPRGVLSATFVGCSAIKGDVTVWVLDDGKRDWVKDLAKSFGFNYVTRDNNDHAKAGNINNALQHLRGDFILILDADHIPMPDIVEAMSGYFINPEIGIVQSPHDFRNRDSAQHKKTRDRDNRRHEQSLFFDVLMPGRQRNDAVFWCGSGAMIRREALMQIGGIQTRTITEDLETTLVLHGEGYKCVYHNEPLIQGLAPHNLAGFLIQRDRWAQGTLRVLLNPKISPLMAKGWGIRARLSYMSNLLYYVLPVQRLTFAIVLILTLITGLLPVGYLSLPFMLYWVFWTVAAMTAAHRLSRGTQSPNEGTNNTWLTSAVYLNAWIAVVTGRKTKFNVTPKEGIDTGGWDSLKMLWLPASILVITASALVFRWTVEILGIGDNLGVHDFDAVLLILMTFFASWEMWTLGNAVTTMVRRRQTRRLWRYPVRIHADVDGIPVTIVDLHEMGVRFETETWPENKIGGKIVFRIPSVSGVADTVNGHFLATEVVDLGTGIKSVRGRAGWSTEEQRRTVTYYMHVLLPYRNKASLITEPS